MKKITLQHANNIIKKVAGNELAYIIITSNDYAAYIEVAGRGNDLNATMWYKALIGAGEQTGIQVADDVDEDLESNHYSNVEINDLSIEDMLKESSVKADRMLGFQLSYRNKLIFVPFRKDRVLSITAVHYQDRVELNFGGMDKTKDGQFISKTWLRTELESGEEVTVSVLSEVEPIEEHIFLPQKNCEPGFAAEGRPYAG